MSSVFAKIQSQSKSPPRIALYGDAGIGKTEFFLTAPNPIYILTEDGLGSRSIAHFPLCKTLQDFQDCLDALRFEAHDYRTVVIDSADWLEKLIHENICATKKVTNVDELAYGKGYTEAVTVFGSILNTLTNLRDEKGMIIAFIAHSQVKRVEDPTQPAFDAHGFKLHRKTAALLEEFCDVVLFATEKMMITTEDAGFGNKRVRPIATGERIIHAVGSPAFTAKKSLRFTGRVAVELERFHSIILRKQSWPH